MNKKPNMNRRQILGLLSVGSVSLFHKKGYALPEKQSEEDTHKSFSTSDLVIKDSLMEMIVDKQLKDNMVVHT